jgi:uncharacterized protein YacL
MVLHILRALFVLLMAAAGFAFVSQASGELGQYVWLTPSIALTIAVVLVCVDLLTPRAKLMVFSGVILGLLVGLLVAYALGFVVDLLFTHYITGFDPEQRALLTSFINLGLSIICSFLAISFILQTKDDFRFIIPFVEFAKATKGVRPYLLDTSALIDGRVADLAPTGLFESKLIVPQFVIDELQLVADSSDKLKRNRGRRGLDVLKRLREETKVEVVLYDSVGPAQGEKLDVDGRLMTLAKDLHARVLTTDFNLNKVAQLRGVEVINLNDIANAIKQAVLPGERMVVRLIKAGEESGQGVGYLDDGTMVVVEQGRSHLNEEVECVVTNTRQTSAGRMIFGRMENGTAGPAAPQSPAQPQKRGPRP